MQPGTSSDIQRLFAAASQHHRAGRLADAERLYRQILQADARHADALHLLGVLAHQLGRPDAAVELIGKAIVQTGTIPAFHNNLGNALKAQGRLDEAVACYVRALSLKPDHAEAHYNLGVALQAQGKLDAAATSYRRALSHKPNHADAYGNLGNILQEQGMLDDAVAAYGRALSYKPNYAEAQGNLANVFKMQGKLAEAVAAYGRALAQKPHYAEAHNNLGIALLQQGKTDEAVASFERAVFHRPGYAEAHSNLGHALAEQGMREKALGSYAQALALKPDYAEARLGLATAAIPLFAGSVADSVGASEAFSHSLQDLTAWDAAHPGQLGKSVGVAQPFYLAYRPYDATGLLSRYGDLVCGAAAAHWAPMMAEARRDRTHAAQDRLRIVVVSGQVRHHPVWNVILRGILAHIDRRRFEISIFHTGPLLDAETAWARAHVDHFVQGPRSMKGWLREIALARPDVIFYPEVGMDPAAGALAALRLAPVQIAGWGHPVTTGLPSIDLFVSGELLEGQGAERHYREKLVRLPGTGVCTELAVVPVQPWEGPDRSDTVVRFALCQQPIKFDPADDALLVRIAKAAGPSEFWLVAPHKLHWATARLRDRLAAAFRAEGLDPDTYLRVTPWLPHEQFLGFLDEMDIFLDCQAFSGYTTAWQAIHRGLPIVTQEGEFLRQRLAAGVLRQIGVTEGIAASAAEYVETAVRWAEECRQSELWAVRREALRRAAVMADGNRAAIVGFEEMLVAAHRGTGTPRQS